jgi:stress response protein SCP2
MKHFISFQKRKGLAVANSDVNHGNDALVHQFNHELMTYGYLIGKDLFDKLAEQSEDTIQVIYNEMITGIRRVTGGGGHEPIYQNFPQSVMALSYRDFVLNAINHYNSFGSWRPEDAEYINREFKLEPTKFKKLVLIPESSVESIFTDILYSGASISKNDKDIVDWFIDNGYTFSLSKITFKETIAYVGKRLLENKNLTILPTKDATNVLRIYSAYSGGYEGLKENTVFKNPSANQVRVLLNTLEKSYNLEESFKVYREKWLKLLFYLNPLTKKNGKLYPNVFSHAGLLRNSPKQLRTFNSRVEELLGNKDIAVLDLLKTRSGVFMRRLDHCVRLFGIDALNKWLETKPNLLQSVTTYNHFTDRDKKQDGRGAVLASQSVSEVVTYDSLEPLDSKLVSTIKTTLLDNIKSASNSELKDKKVYIDRTLYYRPLAMNNRAASLSLDGKVNGTVEVAEAGKTIRMYVHWEGRDDIDLSGLLLTNDNGFQKIGWNGSHNTANSIIYSGDNTGYAAKNAEYLDIAVDKLPVNAEWIINEARIYRGRSTYADYKGTVRAGWMTVKHPEANSHWQPDNIQHAQVLSAKSNTAYLMALHVPTRSLVYLDLAMGNKMVSSADDALKMRMFLESFVTLDKGDTEVQWDKINQGHILNALSDNVVDTKEEADLVFDENTPWENVSKYI